MAINFPDTPTSGDRYLVGDKSWTYDGTGWKSSASSITELLPGTTQTFNQQTGTTYTLVLSDVGKMVELLNAAAITLTIPTNATAAIPVGSRIDLLQTGAGAVTVIPAGGVTLNYKTGNKINGQWASASLLKRATDTWVLIGNLTT